MKLPIEQIKKYSHHCSSCNKTRPLTEFVGIGEQMSSSRNIFGYLVNCKVCSSTIVINKSKDADYEEKVNRVEKSIRLTEKKNNFLL